MAFHRTVVRREALVPLTKKRRLGYKEAAVESSPAIKQQKLSLLIPAYKKALIEGFFYVC